MIENSFGRMQGSQCLSSSEHSHVGCSSLNFSQHDPLPQVICLAGATGTGKTAVALHLASALNGEIVNLDSRQVYHDFPIITAQPNFLELATCVHHAYGFLPTEEKLSAGYFAEMIVYIVREIIARNKVPILVGGTGLYFKTLLEGISPIPSISKDITNSVLERFTEVGSVALYKELMLVDEPYALRIHPNDKQRIARALEVYIATGKPLSWWHANKKAKPYVQGLYLGLDTSLNDLRPKLDKRIDLMLELGALAEATSALEKCNNPKAGGWSGIGCIELYNYLSGNVSWQDTLDLWSKNTKAYAKRQLTWFRAVPSIKWFKAEDIEGMLKEIKRVCLI